MKNKNKKVLGKVSRFLYTIQNHHPTFLTKNCVNQKHYLKNLEYGIEKPACEQALL